MPKKRKSNLSRKPRRSGSDRNTKDRSRARATILRSQSARLCLQSCHDASEENMVQCDGKCARWFHFACVGLTPASVPTGDDPWLCSDCTPIAPATPDSQATKRRSRGRPRKYPASPGRVNNKKKRKSGPRRRLRPQSLERRPGMVSLDGPREVVEIPEPSPVKPLPLIYL